MVLPVRNARIRLTQGQLFSREIGHGEAIVFLHGSWGDGSEWLPVMEQLSAQFHCLAPDLLGCGESDRPAIRYSIDTQVESLTDYLDTLKLHNFILVGRELGGWVAASYALRYGDQVKGLVLLGADGVKLAADRWGWERWLAAPIPVLPLLLQTLRPIAQMFGRSTGIRRMLHYQRQLRRSPAACQMLFKRRRAAIRAELLDSQLAWLKLPVLILQGEDDRSIAVALNQSYTNAPNASLRLVPGGVDVIQTNAGRVAEEICHFAAQIN